jgi:ABC-type antimicrobial peptide transport system permease subunit
MTLGAEPPSAYGLIFKEAGGLTILGIAMRLAGPLAAATLMHGLLFGVRSWDVATLASVAVVLGIAALIASLVPAGRAASVNPIDASRTESRP